jgi:putative ABC transport system permease protein
LSLASAVRGQVAALNEDQAVFNVRTMEQIMAQSVAPRRFSMLLLTVFAVVALGLASIGIYGMMSYAAAAQYFAEIPRLRSGFPQSSRLALVRVGGSVRLACVPCVRSNRDESFCCR